MLGYVTIGAKDSEASGKFYDAFFGAFGHERKFADGGWIGYGAKGSDKHSVYVCPPQNGQPATFGNGSMLAFKAQSRAAVDAFHKAALAAGGSDEGAPGVRGEGSPPFYGAYARDPVGNKLCAYYKG